MSRARKAANKVAREIAARARRAQQHDTTHLDALRAVPSAVDIDMAAERARVETPILADVIRHVGVVPEPPCSWEQGTTLLPVLAKVRDDAELAGAVA